MAEARLIWRKISECEQLAKCSFGANLLFDRLIPHTDDDGRYYADPKKINKLIFTARDDVTDQQIAEWLKELKKQKLLQLYQVNSAHFLRLIKFHEHQPLRKDLRAKILFPEPPKRTGTKHHKAKRAVTPKKVDIGARNGPLRNVPGIRSRSRIRTRKELEKEKESQREREKKQTEKLSFSKFKKEAIAYFNQKADTNFSDSDTATVRLLTAIYSLGYTLDDVKLVISDRVAKWKDNEESRKELEPLTLFEKANFKHFLRLAISEGD